MRLSPSSLDKTADNADTRLRRRKYTQSPPAVFGKNADHADAGSRPQRPVAVTRSRS